MNSKSIFITGGYGLVGSALANCLKGKITLLVRSDNHKDRIKRSDIKVLKKNLSEITSGDLKGCDIIYHCASTVDNYHVLTDPFVDASTNINGTIRLLEACKALKKKPKIIFFSTFFVYGNIYDETKKALTEDSRTNPLALYPATKLCAESIIKLYSNLYGIPYLICRLTNLYSENESYDNKKKGALNYLIMRAVKGEPLSIYIGGNFYRDYIHVDDVISAVKFLEEKKINNQTFLIGYGQSVLFKDIIDYILKLTGNKSDIYKVQPPRFHKVVGIKNFVANTEKINTLGWHPMIDYKTGIKRVVNVYRKIGIH